MRTLSSTEVLVINGAYQHSFTSLAYFGLSGFAAEFMLCFTSSSPTIATPIFFGVLGMGIEGVLWGASKLDNQYGIGA